jgi:hypothetical protein
MRRLFQAVLLDMERACPLRFSSSGPFEGVDSTGVLINVAHQLAKAQVEQSNLDKLQKAYATFSLSIQVRSSPPFPPQSSYLLRLRSYDSPLRSCATTCSLGAA